MYAFVLTDLFLKAYPSMTKDAGDSIIRDQFILGLLSTSLRDKILAADPPTLDQAARLPA